MKKTPAIFKLPGVIAFALMLQVQAQGSLPEDPLISQLPVLKRKSESPIDFYFRDFLTKKEVSSRNLKGKYIFVHACSFIVGNDKQFRELKKLHDKYAPRGFSIISISGFQYPDNSTQDRTVRKNIKQLWTDFGGESWFMAFPTDKSDPRDKFTHQNYFGWLVSPDGKLLHSNVRTIANNSQERDNTTYIKLADALKAVYGD